MAAGIMAGTGITTMAAQRHLPGLRSAENLDFIGFLAVPMI